MLNKPETAAPARKRAPVVATTTAAPAANPATGLVAARVARAGREINQYAGEDRYRLIAERAYFRAELRGFLPGQELEDWLAAEIEVDEMLGGDEPRA